MKLTPEIVARFPRPGASAPQKIAFVPGSRRIAYLFSGRGDLARDLWEMDLATGEKRILLAAAGGGPGARPMSREEELRRERERLRESGVTHFAWADDAPALLVPLRGDAWVDGRVVARGLASPRLSRDGRLLVFVREGEVWAMPLPEGLERRLTSGAAAGLTHGLADYIAQEEMGRPEGLWISPDGRFVAFEEADERHVPAYPIVHQHGDRMEMEAHRYPFAGAGNPRVRLGVVPVAGGPPVWMDLEGDEYLARVSWAPDGRLLAQTQTRDQRRLALRALDPATGRGRVLLVEESELWVTLPDDLKLLPGGEFVWASERTGLKQLELRREERLVRALTAHPFPVDAVAAVAGGRVFYEASGGEPTERRVFSVPLAGGEPACLTPEPGWHGGPRWTATTAVSPDGSCFVDEHESRTIPPTIRVRAADGRVIREVHAPGPVPGLPPPEILSFRARDGETVRAMLYRPERLPAPLVVHVYGGPGVQLVHDTWLATADLRPQFLAQQGILVLKADGRGSARRGVAWQAPIAGCTGEVELRDQVDGVRHATALGLVDRGRVGIYGWSYGGYMTLMALAKAPEVFRAGVAGAPVTHWDGYDTHYTERYMGTPQANPDGYRESSVLTHAGKIRGKLLVIHGMLDENVHFRHTARLVEALNRAGVPHELMLLPGERHMPRDEAVMAAEESRIAEFFERTL